MNTNKVVDTYTYIYIVLVEGEGENINKSILRNETHTTTLVIL